MKVIIAEKRSVALKIADAIGEKQKQLPYGIQAGEDYIVTWAAGHLLELVPLKDLPETKDKKWSEYPLPVIPNEFKFIPKYLSSSTHKEDHLNTVVSYIQEAEEVIHCGDSDREGQLIVDNIIDYAKYTGKISRMWLPEQTRESIQHALENLKPNSEYLSYHNEALARTYADWAMGMNLTVLMRNKTHEKLNVGRVLTPIVRHIYDRDEEIAKFVPQKYFAVESKSNNIPLKIEKKYSSKEEAQHDSNALNQLQAEVRSVSEKEITLSRPKLFSLSKLQEFMSKEYKQSFTDTLNAVQRLYENGYCTYPRTNTEYLSPNESDRVTEILSIHGKERNLSLTNRPDDKKVFDASKVESHSALTPTKEIPEKLSNESEERTYGAIRQRFFEVFCTEEAIASEVKMEIAVGDQTFSLKQKTLRQQGYLGLNPSALQEFEKNNPPLPVMNQGDTFRPEFQPYERTTKKPKEMTEAELSDFLKHPFRREGETEDEIYKKLLSGVEIGTEATRTGIIETAKQKGFISVNKGKMHITELGKYLIEQAQTLKLDLWKEKTVDLQQKLHQVFEGKQTVEDVMKEIRNELKETVERSKNIEVDRRSKVATVCTCPFCHNDVIETQKTFRCKDSDCQFVIFKDSKYHPWKGQRITQETVRLLCETGKTNPLPFQNKEGKSYQARIVLSAERASNGFPKYELEFVNKTQVKKKT